MSPVDREKTARFGAEVLFKLGKIEEWIEQQKLDRNKCDRSLDDLRCEVEELKNQQIGLMATIGATDLKKLTEIQTQHRLDIQELRSDAARQAGARGSIWAIVSGVLAAVGSSLMMKLFGNKNGN